MRGLSISDVVGWKRMHSGVSGYASWIGQVAERDASLTEILIECGAVLYVRTNVPQTLMVRFKLATSCLRSVPDSHP